MKTTFVTVAALMACAAMGCSKESARDGSPGQTTTTGAPTDRRDDVTEGLQTAGGKLEGAAKKAAAEAKDEVKRMDIKVETDVPCRNCDAGASRIRR